MQTGQHSYPSTSRQTGQQPHRYQPPQEIALEPRQPSPRPQTHRSNPQFEQPLTLYPPPFYSQSPSVSSPTPTMLETSMSPASQFSVETPPAESSMRHSYEPLAGTRKRPRQDEGDDDNIEGGAAEEKVKPTRGSRACTVCRRLKMKCVGAENGPPCKRCQTGNHECIFEESNRGKRTTNSSSRKHEQLTRSLKKMEETLDTVLRSINQPGMHAIPSGMVSRSPSPSAVTTATTQALLASPSGSPLLPTHHPTEHPGRSTSPKLHSLPDNALNPLGLLAEASLANRRAQRFAVAQSSPLSGVGSGTGSHESSSQTPKIGVASDTYFKPGPMTILPLRRLYIERQVQPEMLSFTSTEEVVDLFNIFFDHINMHTPLLDRNFHTPSLVCSRSPFLLTAICAVASKFYDKRPDLHIKLNNLVKHLAFNVPEKGYKSVEIVQAYLILTQWGSGPVERYEQDKTWLMLGMAIRIATDLNLHRKTTSSREDTPEGEARDKEVHNRERTWLVCFFLDRSVSAQMGKPHTINEDHIIRTASQFWRSPLANVQDSGIAAYTELQRIVSRSLDFLYSSTASASGLHTNIDYLVVVQTVESQLDAFRREWINGKFMQLASADLQFDYRQQIGNFYYHYATLVINSFGLQDALERVAVNIPHFFSRCYSSAIACVTIVRDYLGPMGYLKYSPDSHFVLCSYAVLTLLKLVRPEFQTFLQNENKIMDIVTGTADTFEQVAVSPLHTPALYGSLLHALVASRTAGADLSGEGSMHNTGTAFSASTEIPAFAVSNGAHPSDPIGMKAGIEGASASFMQPAEFQFNSEMGPVADMSTFPPTMAPNVAEDISGMLTMDNMFSTGFWDSVLVPGYNSAMEGLSGGFVYGSGGSGLITPRVGSPTHSGASSPVRKAALPPVPTFEPMRTDVG